jgi:hypothetical protein
MYICIFIHTHIYIYMYINICIYIYIYSMKVEDQIEVQYRAIQARINELEPSKLRAYNDLLAKQRDFQEKVEIYMCIHIYADICIYS